MILVNKKHDTDPLRAIFRGNDGQVQGLLYPLARTRCAEGMSAGIGRNCSGESCGFTAVLRESQVLFLVP